MVTAPRGNRKQVTSLPTGHVDRESVTVCTDEPVLITHLDPLIQMDRALFIQFYGTSLRIDYGNDRALARG